MTEITLQPSLPVAEPKKKSESAILRVIKFMGIRLFSMGFAILVGLYLTILIANMGGYVDEIQRGQIREDIQQLIRTDPAYKNFSPQQKVKITAEKVAIAEKQLGLDKPFVLRSFSFLGKAINLNLGYAQFMNADNGS